MPKCTQNANRFFSGSGCPTSAEHSLKYENQMYQVGVPWKEHKPILPYNYDMALRRLETLRRD